MSGWLIVASVWALSMLVILRLVSRMTPHYPPPDKWEALPLRACIHVEVTPGYEADVVDDILRTDLDMAREGL